MFLSETYRKIAADGIWNNNIVFGQNLALCPLLAVTGTATNGLGMGLATLVVIIASNGLISVARHLIPSEIRIPIFVLLIAALVTLVDILMNAWAHELYKVLGLFIALIVTNCALLGRAEAFASKQPVRHALWDGLMMGLGFTPRPGRSRRGKRNQRVGHAVRQCVSVAGRIVQVSGSHRHSQLQRLFINGACRPADSSCWLF